MSSKKYETCQHKYRNITCAADFMRNTRMFTNIFFVVLLSLAHGNPVPSDPVNADRCREDPSLVGCNLLDLFGPAGVPDDPTDIMVPEEEGSGVFLTKVEGGDEYLVEMEDPEVSRIHSEFVRG